MSVGYQLYMSRNTNRYARQSKRRRHPNEKVVATKSLHNTQHSHSRLSKKSVQKLSNIIVTFIKAEEDAFQVKSPLQQESLNTSTRAKEIRSYLEELLRAVELVAVIRYEATYSVQLEVVGELELQGTTRQQTFRKPLALRITCPALNTLQRGESLHIV